MSSYGCILLRPSLLQLPMVILCKREGPKKEVVSLLTSSFFVLPHVELSVNGIGISSSTPSLLRKTDIGNCKREETKRD